MTQQSLELRTAYDQICRAHDGIAEFRAKLLGLLPLASGASIFLLIGNEAVTQGNNVLHLIPVGLFGMLITLGLFFYELRGIHKCRGLIRGAQILEAKLLPEDGLWEYAAFNFRQGSLWGFVGATGAALTIYPTVMGAWAYILAVGLRGSANLEEQTNLMPLVVAGVAMAGAFIFGKVADHLNQKKLNERLERLKLKEQKYEQLNRSDSPPEID